MEITEVEAGIMSLVCLVCHATNSPARSFRSSSVSSSDNDEGRCTAIVSCLTGGATSSKVAQVAPFPIMASGPGIGGAAPRLNRSRAVTRDRVRDWNFDEFLVEV